MSRREEEFKHRTSIFEGAYRAWSHLGGLNPNEIFATSNSSSTNDDDDYAISSDDFHRTTATAKDFDPTTYTIPNDVRLSSSKKKKTNDHKLSEEEKLIEDRRNREYPYEPLPRSGLHHPYVQAILSPWLGPSADRDSVELGLATLRTWWQHRRKGENKSALKILGTEKMRKVVDIYTTHFFELAFCLVTSDHVQAPRSLHLKIKKLSGHVSSNANTLMELYLRGSNTSGKDNEDDEELSDGKRNLGNDDHLSKLSPLERMHLVQKNAFETSQNDYEYDIKKNVNNSSVPKIHIKGKCIPGKIDLTGIMDAVMKYQKFAAANLAHRGGGDVASSLTKFINNGNDNDSGSNGKTNQNASTTHSTVRNKMNDEIMQYGDPNTTPIVFVTTNNEYLIVMKVDGITCAHCVKIVETVLKGCSGTGKSPISGLLNAAADHGVSSVVILIDQPKNAKRIAYESKRNLSLVGYTAIPINVQLFLPNSEIGDDEDQEQHQHYLRETLQNAVYDIAKAYPCDFFDFSAPCTCPDSGVYRSNCPRHSQMDDRMFHNLLSDHERRVKEYIDSKRKNLLYNKSSSQDLVGVPSSDNLDEHQPLLIEQPMAFTSHIAIDSASSTVVGDVEPLPYYNIQQHNNHNMIIGRQLPPTPPPLMHQLVEGSSIPSQQQQHRQDDMLYETNPTPMPTVLQQQHSLQVEGVNDLHHFHQHQHQQQQLYSLLNNNNSTNANNANNNHTNRREASALSIDWEVYDLFNEFVMNSDVPHDDDDDDVLLTPMEYPTALMGTTSTSSASSMYPIQQQQPVPSEPQRYYMGHHHGDTF